MERVRITRKLGGSPGKKPKKKPKPEKSPAKGSSPASPGASSTSPLLDLARPRSLLDERMLRRFCRLTKEGMPPDAVCNYLNISVTAFWNWIQKGEVYRKGDGEPKEFALYGAFVGAFRRATAIYLRRTHKDLHRPGNNLWARAMTILERRDRKNYSRHEAPGGGDVSVDPDERFV